MPVEIDDQKQGPDSAPDPPITGGDWSTWISSILDGQDFYTTTEAPRPGACNTSEYMVAEASEALSHMERPDGLIVWEIASLIGAAASAGERPPSVPEHQEFTVEVSKYDSDVLALFPTVASWLRGANIISRISLRILGDESGGGHSVPPQGLLHSWAGPGLRVGGSGDNSSLGPPGYFLVTIGRGYSLRLALKPTGGALVRDESGRYVGSVSYWSEGVPTPWKPDHCSSENLSSRCAPLFFSDSGAVPQLSGKSPSVLKLESVTLCHTKDGIRAAQMRLDWEEVRDAKHGRGSAVDDLGYFCDVLSLPYIFVLLYFSASEMYGRPNRLAFAVEGVVEISSRLLALFLSYKYLPGKRRRHLEAFLGPVYWSLNSTTVHAEEAYWMWRLPIIFEAVSGCVSLSAALGGSASVGVSLFIGPVGMGIIGKLASAALSKDLVAGRLWAGATVILALLFTLGLVSQAVLVFQKNWFVSPIVLAGLLEALYTLYASVELASACVGSDEQAAYTKLVTAGIKPGAAMMVGPISFEGRPAEPLLSGETFLAWDGNGRGVSVPGVRALGPRLQDVKTVRLGPGGPLALHGAATWGDRRLVDVGVGQRGGGLPLFDATPQLCSLRPHRPSIGAVVCADGTVIPILAVTHQPRWFRGGERKAAQVKARHSSAE